MQYSPALENLLFVNLLFKNKTIFYQVQGLFCKCMVQHLPQGGGRGLCLQFNSSAKVQLHGKAKILKVFIENAFSANHVLALA